MNVTQELVSAVLAAVTAMARTSATTGVELAYRRLSEFLTSVGVETSQLERMPDSTAKRESLREDIEALVASATKEQEDGLRAELEALKNELELRRSPAPAAVTVHKTSGDSADFANIESASGPAVLVTNSVFAGKLRFSGVRSGVPNPEQE